jgi:hypothetical protein
MISELRDRMDVGDASVKDVMGVECCSLGDNGMSSGDDIGMVELLRKSMELRLREGLPNDSELVLRRMDGRGLEADVLFVGGS